jgi:hypothetical protein
MARRTVNDIYVQMVLEKNNQAAINALQPSIDDEQTLLSDLTTPSRVAKWRLFFYIVAFGIWVHEGLQELLRTEIETIVAKAAPATPGWIQQKVFEFQYSATTEQIATLIDFIVEYPTVDETLRIITRCSVKTFPNRVVGIKVAKQEPPVPLNSTEMIAAASYVQLFLPAGVRANIISMDADRLFLDADIYYDGQYSSVIQQNVIAAIDTFLAKFSKQLFDGTLPVSWLEDAIQAVPGVRDIIINEVRARDNGTPFANAFIVIRQWQTVAGYIIQEDTAGNTFADTLTFIAE